MTDQELSAMPRFITSLLDGRLVAPATPSSTELARKTLVIINDGFRESHGFSEPGPAAFGGERRSGIEYADES